MRYLTLMLNATFQPLDVVNWRHAVKKMCKESDRYQLLEAYEDDPIQSGSEEWQRPKVVRLTTQVEVPQSIFKPSFTRENIYKRDDYRCQYCGEEKERHELTWDHVFPQSRGGETDWSNIVTSCEPCNHGKGDRTPQEAGMSLISEPQKPHWTPVQRMNLENYPDEWEQYLWN